MPTEGEQVTFLYDVFLVAAGGLFVVVAALIGWSIVSHRDAADARAGARSTENVRLELLWWALPTALVIILIILTAQVVSGTTDPSGATTS